MLWEVAAFLARWRSRRWRKAGRGPRPQRGSIVRAGTCQIGFTQRTQFSAKMKAFWMFDFLNLVNEESMQILQESSSLLRNSTMEMKFFILPTLQLPLTSEISSGWESWTRVNRPREYFSTNQQQLTNFVVNSTFKMHRTKLQSTERNAKFHHYTQEIGSNSV